MIFSLALLSLKVPAAVNMCIANVTQRLLNAGCICIDSTYPLAGTMLWS